MIDIKQSYVSPILSRLAQRYENREYIASQIFPFVPCPKDTVKYAKFDRASMFKRATTKYGPRSSPNEIELKVTLGTHSLTPRGLEGRVTDEERRLSDVADPHVAKMESLKNGMLLDLELEVATAMTTAASYAAANKATLAGTSQWSDYVNSDPKTAVVAAARGLIKPGNTMVVGEEVHIKLINHPKVLDAIKYTTGGLEVTNQQLARYFGMKRYFVGEAFYDTAQDGQPEALARIWGKFAWVGHVAYEQPTALSLINSASFGYLPIGMKADGSSQLWRVYQKPADPEKGSGDGPDWMKVDALYDPLFTSFDLGYLFSAAVA